MEIVVPLFALSSLYLINNQNKQKDTQKDGFSSGSLPNICLFIWIVAIGKVYIR